MATGGLEKKTEALLPKKFVDRDDVRDIITRSMEDLQKKDSYHKIISIHGMGGIGKSRFLHEIKRFISDESHKIELIYATLEIVDKNDFHSLLSVRREIPKTCYMFDYALNILVDRCLVEKISDNFLTHIGANWVTDFITLAQGMSPLPMPGVNDCINVLNQLIDKFIKTTAESHYRNELQNIKAIAEDSPKKLLNLLPDLLGNDLCRIAKKNKLVVILDSCNNSESWLNGFLVEANAGVFILTSREPLSLQVADITTYHMQELPQKEAKRYLESYITNEHHRSKLIPNLISATECIPIYLDLAVSTYLHCTQVLQSEWIAELLIRNKDDLINTFLDHLPTDQQEAILVLAVVSVFDAYIFAHLVADLNLSATKLSYHQLSRISLVDNLNENCDIRAFHSIFSSNVAKLVPTQKKQKIFQSYLRFLVQRGRYLYPNETQRVYFENVLDLVLVNNFELTAHENEDILDLFFSLVEQRIECSFIQVPQNATNSTLSVFLSATMLLHSDTLACLAKLSTIRNSIGLLGKHQNSYYAIECYCLSIQGQYTKTKHRLADLCGTLRQDAITDWYYGKLKIYLADIQMLTGDFKEAIMALDKYREEIEPYTMLKENDIFELQKQKGHCYRFNFFLDKAAAAYENLYHTYAENSVMKSYCLTSLCETRCFFDPQYVIDHHQESLKTAQSVGQERSRAKIYYSLGIAYTIMRDFPTALRNINQSIELNKQCCYPSGTLMALISKSYYCYAKSGFLQRYLVEEIETISSELEVYGYLLLPVYLMRNDEEKINLIKERYHWMDWNHTLKSYKRFIQSLSN